MENHSEMPRHTHYDGYYLKKKKQEVLARMQTIAGGNVKFKAAMENSMVVS